MCHDDISGDIYALPAIHLSNTISTLHLSFHRYVDGSVHSVLVFFCYQYLTTTFDKQKHRLNASHIKSHVSLVVLYCLQHQGFSNIHF